MERIIGSRDIYNGKIVRLALFDVELPDGYRSTREIVLHPGSVAIVPLHEDRQVTLVRQFRLAAEGELIEIPAGTLEPGEDPVSCARRELKEEAGLQAGTLQPLAVFYPAPGIITERMHLYLATGLEEVEGQSEEDERIEVLRMPLHRAIELIREGTIRDAKSIIGLLWANFLSG